MTDNQIPTEFVTSAQPRRRKIKTEEEIRNAPLSRDQKLYITNLLPTLNPDELKPIVELLIPVLPKNLDGYGHAVVNVNLENLMEKVWTAIGHEIVKIHQTRSDGLNVINSDFQRDTLMMPEEGSCLELSRGSLEKSRDGPLAISPFMMESESTSIMYPSIPKVPSTLFEYPSPNLILDSLPLLGISMDPPVFIPLAATPQVVTSSVLTPPVFNPSGADPPVFTPLVAGPPVFTPPVTAPRVVTPQVLATTILSPSVIPPSDVSTSIVSPLVVLPVVPSIPLISIP